MKSSVASALTSVLTLVGLLVITPQPVAAAGTVYDLVHRYGTELNTNWLDLDDAGGMLAAVAEGAPTFGRPPLLTIIDVSKREIPVGQLALAEAGDVAFSPGNRTIYVAQPTARTILAVDVATARVRATIPVLGAATRLELDPALGRLYGITDSGNLLVVDTNSDTLARIVAITRAEKPAGLAVNTVNHEVYVDRGFTAGPSAIEVVDGRTLRVVDYITVNYAVSDLAMSPRSDRLYVLGSALTVINPGRRTVEMEAVDIGGTVFDVAPSTGLLYVGNARLGTLMVADPDTGSVRERATTTTSVMAIEHDGVRDEILLGGGWSSSVDVLGRVPKP